MMDIKNQVQKLIAENKIKDALDVFMIWAVEKQDGQLQNSLITIQQKFVRLKQQENMGIIQFSDSLREQAIITSSILEFVSQISEKPMNGGAIPPSDSTRKVILFLASNPSDTSKLQLEKEFVRISTGIQQGAKDLRLVSEWAIKPGDLQQAILRHRPNIIHFSGHGIGDNKGTGSDRDISLAADVHGGIVLQDANGNPKLVNAAALADLFGTMLEHKDINIEVVILNACHQEEQAKAIAKHVPYVIGTNDAINDNVAIEFSTGFYRGISAKDSKVEFAFRLARNNIMLEGLEDSTVPVLYVQGIKA